MKQGSRFLVMLAGVVVIAACGGASEYAVQGMAPAQGADGEITVEATDAGNQTLVVTMNHLMPPDRLGNGLTSYVVWIIPEGRDAELAGILAYDPEERTGQLMTTTPYPRFQVLVTAEAERRPHSPGEIIVVRRSVTS